MIHEDFMIGSEDMDIDAVCEKRRCGPRVPPWQLGLLKQPNIPPAAAGDFFFC